MKTSVVRLAGARGRRGARAGLASAAGVLVLAVTLAACGSSDTAQSDTAQSDSGGGGKTVVAGGVRTADAAVEALRRTPQPLDIPALPKRPAAGTSAVRISCKLPECASSDAVVQQASDRLGWKLHIIKPDLTPEGFAGAWTQAVAAKPDVILAYDVVPLSIITRQLDQAEREGIKIVMSSGPSHVGDHGIDATIGALPYYRAGSVALIDWAVADSGGDAHIAWVHNPSVPMENLVLEQVRKELRRLCAKCTVDPFRVQGADAGKVTPGKVVSYLQQHPDVKYVLAAGSGVMLGVAQAVKAAGLPAKIGTSHAQVPDLEAVDKGVAAVAVATEPLGWRVVDAAARLVERAPLPASLADPEGERQLFDKTNVASADLKATWTVPEVESTFLRAWHVT
ncbi:MAG: ribose transport system substrate-binding protein [Solirubrobacteraceae bacterium]